MKLVLGLDIGIASVGWAVVNKETAEILESGVRLFNSADVSNNKDRRTFRGIRRNKRRQQNRLQTMQYFLESNGIDRPEIMDATPVELRCKGLEEKLTKAELFVSIYNLCKHRGISYLEDVESDEKETDGLSENIKLLKEKFPCTIQLERLNEYGLYRGNNVINEKVLVNTFTTKAYENELREILKCQSKYYDFITKEFIQKAVKILRSKREYYIGPGNEKSRTNYGIFKTDGTTKDNLFDELRGKCSVYSGKHGMEPESRAASASYTAQYYNLLNDLCNIKVDGEKLSVDQKRHIIEIIKNNKTAKKITDILKKEYKIEPESVSGFRMDGKGNEENHTFEPYRKLRDFKDTVLEKIDNVEKKHSYNLTKEQILQFESNKFSENQLDMIADVLTLNTETDSIKKYFSKEDYNFLTENDVLVLTEFRRKNSKLFAKWHAFSYRLMKQIIPEMLESGDEQHTVITRMKLIKYDEESFGSKINVEDILDEIYNPVVTRSIRQTIKIVNALMSKHKVNEKKSDKYEFSDIVIEMPRENNEKEKKQAIEKGQKANEDLKEKAIEYAGLDGLFVKNKGLLSKLKLYYKQGGKCLYSGVSIDVDTLQKDVEKVYEIDHIIPISISFDDSQANKVLVLSGENQRKGQRTPFQYLKSKNGSWNYEMYKAYVLDLYKKKLIGRKHKDNFLEERDITKQEVVQEFIARNLNDTRYSSRVVLNSLQKFFKDKETKIKVVNGQITQQFRNGLKFKTADKSDFMFKDREKDYRHHAVDAMICCYTSMSLDKYNEQYINMETGEIIDKDIFKKQKNDKYDKDLYLSYSKFAIRKKIEDFYDHIKFSHKVDRKVNRGISDQTIYGTRSINNETYIVSKIGNIYDKDTFKKTFKKLLEKDNKDPELSKENKFLMYRYDNKTWQILMDIIKQYPDEDNPFDKYRSESEENKLRKYSKKGNGPEIKEIKYLVEKLGRHIDITNHYDSKNKVIMKSMKPFRCDVYYNSNLKKHHLVQLYYSDFKFDKGNYVVNKEAYLKRMIERKVIDEAIFDAIKNKDNYINELSDRGYEYRYSLYRGDIIVLEKEDVQKTIKFKSATHTVVDRFEYDNIDGSPEFDKNEKEISRKYENINNFSHNYKLSVDILGNGFKVEKEIFSLKFKLDNKMI